MIEPRLEETGRGKTVHSNGRYLYSRYNPVRRSEQAAESAPLKNKCIYLVPSPLLGYGLTHLAHRIPDDSIIITIEQSQEMMALCSRDFLKNMGDSRGDDSRIVNVRLSDRDSLHALLYSLGPWRFRRVHRVDLTSGSSLNPELYDELTDFLMEDVMSYWRNRHALGRLGREWVRHTFANLSLIADGCTSFQDFSSFKTDRIPVVAGAGPSLESSFEFLALHRDKLWIMAVDTALPALLKNGITPDTVAVLDTQAWNLLDFHGSSSSKIPVIADITSYPPCITHTGGPCYLYSSEFAELDFLHRLKDTGLRDFTIPPLGSVGLAALEIISRISSGPVFLTGLDFAYSPGKSHARGSSFHHWQLSSISRLNPHPGWEASVKRPRIKGFDASGLPRDSDTVLMGYASLLKDRYSSDKSFHVLEPGGLYLGIPVISFIDAKAIIEGNIGGISENGQVVSLQDTAALFLKEELEGFKRVISAWEAYAEGNGSAADVAENLKRMDEVFADFPDEPPLPKEDDSFLVRAVSRVRQLQRYIERLRS